MRVAAPRTTRPDEKNGTHMRSESASQSAATSTAVDRAAPGAAAGRDSSQMSLRENAFSLPSSKCNIHLSPSRPIMMPASRHASEWYGTAPLPFAYSMPKWYAATDTVSRTFDRLVTLDHEEGAAMCLWQL